MKRAAAFVLSLALILSMCILAPKTAAKVSAEGERKVLKSYTDISAPGESIWLETTGWYAAAAFNIDRPVYGVSIPVCWSSNPANPGNIGGQALFEIYRHTNSIESSMSETPLWSETIDFDHDLADGVSFSFDPALPAGAYVFSVTELTGDNGGNVYFVIPKATLAYPDRFAFLSSNSGLKPFCFEVETDADASFIILPGCNELIDCVENAEDGGSDPHNLLASGSLAVKTTVPEGTFIKQIMGVNSPSWGNSAGTGSSMRATIYDWNTDYASSVAGTPLASADIYDHSDGMHAFFCFDKDSGDGEKLIVFESIGSNHVGFWSGKQTFEETVFKNGAACPGYFIRANIYFADPVPRMVENATSNTVAEGVAVSLASETEKNPFGVRFNAEAEFGGFSIFSATWNFTGVTANVKIYEYEGNWEDTLAAEPAAVADAAVADNSWVSFYFKEIPAGEYIAVLTYNGTKGGPYHYVISEPFSDKQMVYIGGEPAPFEEVHYRLTYTEDGAYDVGDISRILQNVAVSVGNDMVVRVTADNSYCTEYGDKLQAVFVVDGEEQDPVPENGGVFTLEGLDLSDMNASIGIVLLNDGVVVDAVADWSVNKYLTEDLAGTPYAELAANVSRLGSEIDKYFGGDGWEVSDDASEIGEKTDYIPAAAVISNGEADKFTSAQLYIDDNFNLRFNFAAANATKIVINDSVEITDLSKGYVMTDDISVTELTKIFTVEMYNGDELLASVKYSAANYIYNKFDATESAQNKIIRALAAFLPVVK